MLVYVLGNSSRTGPAEPGKSTANDLYTHATLRFFIRVVQRICRRSGNVDVVGILDPVVTAVTQGTTKKQPYRSLTTIIYVALCCFLCREESRPSVCRDNRYHFCINFPGHSVAQYILRWMLSVYMDNTLYILNALRKREPCRRGVELAAEWAFIYARADCVYIGGSVPF